MSLQCQDLGLVSNIQRRNLTHEMILHVDNLFVIEKQEQGLRSDLKEKVLHYVSNSKKWPQKLRNGPELGQQLSSSGRALASGTQILRSLVHFPSGAGFLRKNKGDHP